MIKYTYIMFLILLGSTNTSIISMQEDDAIEFKQNSIYYRGFQAIENQKASLDSDIESLKILRERRLKALSKKREKCSGRNIYEDDEIVKTSTSSLKSKKKRKKSKKSKQKREAEIAEAILRSVQDLSESNNIEEPEVTDSLNNEQTQINDISDSETDTRIDDEGSRSCSPNMKIALAAVGVIVLGGAGVALVATVGVKTIGLAVLAVLAKAKKDK